jgi:hypothetical protein
LERDQKRRFESLEATTGHVVSIFLNVADTALKSPWAQKDAQLMGTLRQSISSILSALGDVKVDVDAQRAAWENHPASPMGANEATEGLDDFAQTTSFADHRDEAGNESFSSSSSSYASSLLPTDPITTYAIPNDMAKPPPSSSPPSRRIDNIFGNGWMGSMASYDFFTQPDDASLTLDSPLTLQITYYTLQRGYQALLNIHDVDDPRIRRAFGYLLQRCSRDEILRSLRWRLSRPVADAAAEMRRLATTTLSQASALFDPTIPDLDDYAYNKYATIVPAALAVFEDLCNADEVAAMLRQRTRGDATRDVLEVAVPALPSVSLAEDTMYVADGPVRFPWRTQTVEDPDGGMTNGYHGQTATTHIRVSKSILLNNLSINGSCLGAGPMFPRSKLDSIIMASALPSSA